MDETGWSSRPDPQKPLDFPAGRPAGEKRWPFACACCRRTWGLLTLERSQKAVEGVVGAGPVSDDRSSDPAGGLPVVVLDEALPVVHELAPELGNAAGRQAVPVRHVQRPLAEHQVLDDAAVTLAAAPDPGREVEAEGNLLGHVAPRVVAQGLVEGVAQQPGPLRQ